MTTENAWIQADIHFRNPQNLGTRGSGQTQASSVEIQFGAGWLHIRPNNQDITEIVSVPADTVDRIHWKG